MSLRPQILTSEKRLSSRGKAVTIGVGYFSAQTGPRIVLGSDMELTAVAKYKAVKNNMKWFDIESGQAKGVFASVYAGKEDDMRNVWENFEREIDQQEKTQSHLSCSDVRGILEKALKVVQFRDFQMLVGITKETEQPIYLRASYRTTAPAQNWEVIGGGAVELTRYLIELMNYAHLTVEQAVLWTIYMIHTASSYVQGVGQGIRITINDNGRVHLFDGDIYSANLSTFRDYLSGMWFDFCNLTLSEGEFAKRLDSFRSASIALRRKMPQSF